jgi:TatD DNase family protein
MLTDTHAHICSDVFDDDRGAVLQRARRSGIRAVVAVGEDLADAERNMDLARQFPILKPAAGLYPTQLDLAAAQAMITFIQANRALLCAIGEVGLDYWMVKTEAERVLQKEIFTGFIALALELDLPLNVHSRSAGRHAIDLLIRNGARKVQLHAFDGKITTARPALEAGYYFSIPPSTVRSRQKQKLLRHLPLESLLVESDSPVLGPEPGVRNEPANLAIALRAIADIKGVPESQVREAVVANTHRLYGF